MFEITATGLPRPDAKWYKDGKVLKISNRVKYQQTGEVFQLSISKAVIEDSGVYSCIFTNKQGEKTLEGFLNVETVDELRKPKFIEPLKDVDVDKDTTGMFKAVVTGEPIPEAVW